MRHIISVLLENEAGALSRVTGLFSARGYNIDSLNVSITENPHLSRMTIVTHGSNEVIQQITKQVNKLIEVIKVIDIKQKDYEEKELVLLKLKLENNEISTIKNTLKQLDIKYNIIDEHNTNNGYSIYIFEIVDNVMAIDKFINNIEKSKILELARTGASAMGLGENIFRVDNY